MADSINPIAVVAGAWTNIYAQASIVVGTAVTVQHEAGGPVHVCVSLAEPTTERAALIKAGDWFSLPANESGLWMYGYGKGAKLNIQED